MRPSGAPRQKWIPRAERQVRVGLAFEEEVVGVVEDLRVAVRGVEQEAGLRALRDPHAVELERLEHPALEHRERCLEPEQLLDRGRQEGGPRAAPSGDPDGGTVRAIEERRVHAGLVPRVQQQDARAHELVLGESLALVDHVDETGDQVLARACAPPRARPRRYSANSMLARTASSCEATDGFSSYIFTMSADQGRRRDGRAPGRPASRRSPSRAAAPRASAACRTRPRRRRRRPAGRRSPGRGAEPLDEPRRGPWRRSRACDQARSMSRIPALIRSQNGSCHSGGGGRPISSWEATCR